MILSLSVDLVSEQMYSSVKFWLNGPLAACSGRRVKVSVSSV